MALGLTNSSWSPGAGAMSLGQCWSPAWQRGAADSRAWFWVWPLWRHSRQKAALGKWQVGTRLWGAGDRPGQHGLAAGDGAVGIAPTGELLRPQPGPVEGDRICSMATQLSSSVTAVAPCLLTPLAHSKALLVPGQRRRRESGGVSLTSSWNIRLWKVAL